MISFKNISNKFINNHLFKYKKSNLLYHTTTIKWNESSSCSYPGKLFIIFI